MNRRIKTICGMVKKGMIVADIGTDHAQLPIYLVSSGICPKAYACDVAVGPLNIANENIKNTGLSDRIETILSDGFENIPDDVEVAVIAGMGTRTVISILETAYDRLSNLSQLLIQVNDDIPLMREWIFKHRFSINDEEYINDKNHDYIIISVDTTKSQDYCEEDIICGPILRTIKKEQLKSYAEKHVDKITKLLNIKNLDESKKLSLNKELSIWEKYI